MQELEQVIEESAYREALIYTYMHRIDVCEEAKRCMGQNVFPIHDADKLTMYADLGRKSHFTKTEKNESGEEIEVYGQMGMWMDCQHIDKAHNKYNHHHSKKSRQTQEYIGNYLHKMESNVDKHVARLTKPDKPRNLYLTYMDFYKDDFQPNELIFDLFGYEKEPLNIPITWEEFNNRAGKVTSLEIAKDIRFYLDFIEAHSEAI